MRRQEESRSRRRQEETGTNTSRRAPNHMFRVVEDRLMILEEHYMSPEEVVRPRPQFIESPDTSFTNIVRRLWTLQQRVHQDAHDQDALILSEEQVRTILDRADEIHAMGLVFIANIVENVVCSGSNIINDSLNDMVEHVRWLVRRIHDLEIVVGEARLEEIRAMVRRREQEQRRGPRTRGWTWQPTGAARNNHVAQRTIVKIKFVKQYGNLAIMKTKMTGAGGIREIEQVKNTIKLIGDTLEGKRKEHRQKFHREISCDELKAFATQWTASQNITAVLDIVEAMEDEVITEQIIKEKKKHKCPVCLDKYYKLESVKQCPGCKNFVHDHCIRRWLSDKETCPLCRHIITVL